LQRFSLAQELICNQMETHHGAQTTRF
jgi:hypothetical protein